MTPFYSEEAFNYAIIKGLESLMSVTVTVGTKYYVSLLW